MVRTDQLVLAFFETEGDADGAAGALRGWAARNRRVELDAVGVLVNDENGEVKAAKLGPRGVGSALGALVDAQRVASKLDAGQAAVGALVPRSQAAAISDELEALGGEPEVHTVDETILVED